jgi:hypothetical protein
MDLMTAIAAIPGVGPVLPYLAVAVAACALLAMALPPPATGGSAVYATLYRMVNLVAANKGHATNANAPAVSTATTTSK